MSGSDERMVRIEEAQAFAERSIEQLHEELLSARRAIETMSKRIDRIERRLSSVEESAEGSDDSAE